MLRVATKRSLSYLPARGPNQSTTLSIAHTSYLREVSLRARGTILARRNGWPLCLDGQGMEVRAEDSNARTEGTIR